uniref:Reverse transcriptase N-terminal domain-containing protein n=1 Tax=Dasya naccarioides TaxID=2007180 RepID=A0A1Z1MGF7_9FLOR|nr:hypothetical protein [Dasya naccarioides]ARW65160.1 hypothetical protein [Dasya naccarioides]
MKYNLNVYTNWKVLPWKKIYTRIQIIQIKIYKATKQNDWRYLSLLKKYILNSNEAKVIAIKNIIDNLYIFSKYRKKIKLFIRNEDKFKILLSLYNYKLYDSSKFYYILNQIKDYLTYLCIKPQCEAKFIFSFYENKKINIFKYFNYIDTCFFKLSLNNKNIFTQYIINNIKLLNDIDRKFYDVINTNISGNLIRDNNFIKQVLINQFVYLNDLFLLLSNIFFVGTNWYQNNLNISYLTKNNRTTLYYNNKILNLKSGINNKIYQYLLIKNIKLFLYKEKTLCKLIKIKYLYKNNILANFIFINFIRLIYPIFNLLIYALLKKNSGNILWKHKNIKINNISFNIFFYNKKVQYIYCNYCY